MQFLSFILVLARSNSLNMISLLFFALAQVGISSPDPQHLCPPPDIIRPCLCEEPLTTSEAPSLYCDKINNQKQMKHIMSEPLPSQHLRRLDVSTGMVGGTITSDLFGNLTIEELYLMNDMFSSVAPDAFDNSAERMRILNLEGNQLTDFPYESLKLLTALHSIWLGSNLLSTIPDKAFGEHPTLAKIDLASNKIQSIGKGAFHGLTNLQFLWMDFNQLHELGPESLHFDKSPGFVTLYLANNKIEKVAPGAVKNLQRVSMFLNENRITELLQDPFKQLIDNAKYSLINIGGNYLSCNCSMQWAMGSSPYGTHILNAMCSDNTPMYLKNITC